MYENNYRVMLPDTDAAGILFFGNYIKLAHHVYEEFMETNRLGLRQVLDEEPFLILIVATEGEFKKSLRLGDKYRVQLTVEKIGKTSFTLKYRYLHDGETVATVTTVHVAVDKESNKPIKLDETLKMLLEANTQ